ncbi:Rpn family recombination-promoting nuclease/putative transposase [Desulfatirhabdium butyrativorans]|uniref:Rpn family recombination-promoting nuclease/putative transposase n=1 Tax=Desulfatirhabdium butyrativorans TaxID=340467 RepID=UPI0004838636|nr:Rpn family recombination-promoting nuclease/putative transposase [Desulfatirhabdium butyrativorans]
MRHIPNFQLVLIDLSRFSDAEIQGEALLRASLLLFKYVFTPEYRDRLPGIFALLKSLSIAVQSALFVPLARISGKTG